MLVSVLVQSEHGALVKQAGFLEGPISLPTSPRSAVGTICAANEIRFVI